MSQGQSENLTGGMVLSDLYGELGIGEEKCRSEMKRGLHLLIFLYEHLGFEDFAMFVYWRVM